MSNNSQMRVALTLVCSLFVLLDVPAAFAQAEIIEHEASTRVYAQSRIGIWLNGNLAECEAPGGEQYDAWTSSLQSGPQTCGPVEPYPGLSEMTDGGATSAIAASPTVITLNVTAGGSAATIQPEPGYQLAYAQSGNHGGAHIFFRFRSSAYITISYSIQATLAADPGGWGSTGYRSSGPDAAPVAVRPMVASRFAQDHCSMVARLFQDY